MTNLGIDLTRPIRQQLQEYSDETLTQLWAEALQDANVYYKDGLTSKLDYLIANAVLESVRQEMTWRIQGKLDHLFAKDMDRFLPIMKFLAFTEPS